MVHMMVQAIKPFGVTDVTSIIKTCLTHEAPHLYLDVRGAAQSYVFRYRFPGTPHQKALAIGSAHKLSLERAKRQANIWNEMLLSIPPRDPACERIRDTVTFAELLEQEMDAKPEGWGERQVWEGYGRNYFPRLMPMRPCHITRQHVIDCLRDAWGTVTAERALYVVSEVMKRAKAHQLAFGENPAEKDAIVRLLGAARTSEPELQASIPYADMPAFLARALSPKTGHWMGMGIRRKALLVQASVPYRSDEVRTMRRQDVNLETGEWTTSGENNKIGAAQINILPAQVLAVLRSIENVGDYFFASPKAPTKPIAPGATLEVMRDEMKVGKDEGSIHGFRSSIVTFAIEHLGVDKQIAKDMLGHAPKKGAAKKDNFSRYARPEWVKKRADVLQAWADHIYPADFLGTNVVQLRA